LKNLFFNLNKIMKLIFEFKITKIIFLTILYFIIFNIFTMILRFIFFKNIELSDLVFQKDSLMSIFCHFLSLSFFSIILFEKFKISKFLFIILNTLFTILFTIIFMQLYLSYIYDRWWWHDGIGSWFFIKFGDLIQFWLLFLLIFILSFSKKYRKQFFNQLI